MVSEVAPERRGEGSNRQETHRLLANGSTPRREEGTKPPHKLRALSAKSQGEATLKTNSPRIYWENADLWHRLSAIGIRKSSDDGGAGPRGEPEYVGN